MAMKPRVVGFIKPDESDLEKLLPLNCEDSSAYVSYTTRNTSNCGSVFLRTVSVFMFVAALGMAAGWFIHCAVFMNTTPHRMVLDTRLFFHLNDTDVRVQDIEEKLAPSLLGRLWNNGSIDLDMLREVIGVLIGKDIDEVVIPADVMGGLMKHLSDILNQDFSFFLTDTELQKSIFAMFTQQPTNNVTVPNPFLSLLASFSDTENIPISTLLTAFPNVTALSKMISDTTDTLHSLAQNVHNGTAAVKGTTTATTFAPEDHDHHHHHHHNESDHDR